MYAVLRSVRLALAGLVGWGGAAGFLRIGGAQVRSSLKEGRKGGTRRENSEGERRRHVV